MHQTLTIPQHRDPVARAALIACALALAWLAVTSALPQASAQEQPETIILVATPTLAPPTEAPAVVVPALAAATAIPPTFAPRPLMLTDATLELDCDPAEVLYIGDMETDKQAAVAAGCRYLDAVVWRGGTLKREDI